MSAEDVEAAVIQPMLAEYPAPGNLRNNPEALEARLNRYRVALCRFQRPVLEAGFQLAAERNDVYCWPGLKDLIDACNEVYRRDCAGKGDALVEKANELADSYTRRFMRTSQHAARAREGGYEAELKGYVRAASWVQAQYAVGQQGVGYDHDALFGRGPRDREAEADWFAGAREQASRGHVRVSVPPALVRRWQQQAEAQGRAR